MISHIYLSPKLSKTKTYIRFKKRNIIKIKDFSPKMIWWNYWHKNNIMIFEPIIQNYKTTKLLNTYWKGQRVYLLSKQLDLLEYKK